MTEYSQELMLERAKFKRQLHRYIYDESEALELFLEGSDYLGIILDSQGVILRANEALCSYLDFQNTEMEDKHLADFIYPPGTRLDPLKEVQKNVDHTITHYFYAKGGEKKPITWVKSRQDKNGYRYAKGIKGQ